MDNPKNLDNLFEGLEHQSIATEYLKASIGNNRIAPAYIFVGPKGVGQREIAIRFLEGLINSKNPKLGVRDRLENRNHPDLLWVEPTFINEGKLINKSIADKQGISNKLPPQVRLDQIRDIKSFLGRRPLEAKLGMVVIEDIDNINEAASNALLKTLEEPLNGLIILISSRPEKLLSTIKSRCQHIPFKGLNSQLMKAEFINIKPEPEIIQYENILLNISNGSPESLIENIKLIRAMPSNLLEELQDLAQNNLQALTLAKTISEELNKEEQLWLITFLQQHFWEKTLDLKIAQMFEKLRKYIISSIQPRIAWEITLIQLIRKD